MELKLKALVVDDEPLALKILHDCLDSAGYHVVTAKDGLEAWNLLTSSQHNFAVIITDRVMPGMDGIELTRKIQTQPAFKHIPVIMLTSAAEREEVIAAVRGGVYDFLLKPIEKDLLLMVTKRALAAASVAI